MFSSTTSDVLKSLHVALFLIPGAAIFPFIYWIVEGSFPIQYMTVWAVGMVCSALAGALLSRR